LFLKYPAKRESPYRCEVKNESALVSLTSMKVDLKDARKNLS
jgi:hypothetical protein